MPPQPPSLTHVADVGVDIGPVLTIGATGSGLREVIPIAGGRVAGPLLTAEVLPGGADWCLTRSSGIAEVWARYTIRAADGTLIMVTNSGFAHPSPNGDWLGTTTPRFEVATGSKHAWLNTATFVGTLHASGELVAMRWWRVERG